MKEQELMEFIEWLPKNIKEFAEQTNEQVVESLNKLWQSEEGKEMLQQMIKLFQKSKQPMFKKGGELKKCSFGSTLSKIASGANLVSAAANFASSLKKQKGGIVDTPNGPIFETENGYVDVDGRPVDYRTSKISQWKFNRDLQRRWENEALSQAAINGKVVLDTFDNKPWENMNRAEGKNPQMVTDTIVVRKNDNGSEDRERASSFKTFWSRKLFGDSKFDKINREYEDNFFKKQEGGTLRTYVGGNRPIPNGQIGYYNNPTTLTVELPNQTYGYLINKGDTIAFTKPEPNGSLAKRVYNPRERRAIIDHVNSIDQKYGQEDPGLGTKYEWYNKFGERIKVPGQTGLYQRRSDRVDAVWTPEGGVLRVKQPDGTYVYTDNLYDVEEGLYNQDSLKRVFTKLYNSPSTYPEGPKDSKSVKTYKK